MKKIAFVIEDMSSKGGRETVLASLAEALSPYYEVHILCVTQKNKELAYEFKEGIYYSYFTYFEGRIRERFMRSCFKMRQYALKNKVDVVLGIGSSVFMICAVMTQFTNIKFIGCEHSNLKNNFYDPLERFSQKVGAYTTDYLVTLTKKDMKNWIERYHVNPKKIGYCYNPIVPRDDYEIYEGNHKKILSIGRITRVKQFHLIPQIASDIFSQYPDWSWDIYGDGDNTYIEEIKQEIEKYHLEEKVLLKGNHPNPHEIYGQYDVFVLCSAFEGLPVVLLEAKQHHLPIVAFDCQTGPSEIVEDGISGILVKQDDLMGMKDALRQLIESEDLRKKYASHAKDNLHLFEKNHIMNQWMALIERVLK